METLLRTQLSPVPAQTTLGFFGSMATAPMDCTPALSNTGLNVLPPLTDFHTPPLADAAKTVSRPPSLTAATAAMRPLISAEPMLRAARPETVPASNRMGVCAGTSGANSNAQKQARLFMAQNSFPPAPAGAAGTLNSRGSTAALASILSMAILAAPSGFCLLP